MLLGNVVSDLDLSFVCFAHVLELEMNVCETVLG